MTGHPRKAPGREGLGQDTGRGTGRGRTGREGTGREGTGREGTGREGELRADKPTTGAEDAGDGPVAASTAPRRRPGRFGGPRRLDDSLGTLVNRWGAGADPAQVASVFSRWEEIAGPALAEHVHPVRMAGDTLVVAADHPAWATRARAEGPTILRSVGELAGTAPTRLDVVVRRR